MISRNRKMAANIAAAGVLAVGAAVASAATAAADPAAPPCPGCLPPADPAAAGPVAPPPPVDPMNPPPVSSFAQAALQYPLESFQLAQTAAPAVPGSAPAYVPNNDVMSAGNYLNPLNFRMPPPDAENPYELGQGDPNAGGLVNSLKGARGLFHGMMGKLDPTQLGDPLPGTAPPPGTNIPPGLGFGLPDPGPPAPLRDPVPPEGFFGAPPPIPPGPSPYAPPPGG